jgi:hypothetical protein
VFFFEKKLLTGTDNKVSEWNQYRYDTGITFHNLTSVPMRADPEARCIKINICIPAPLAKYQNGINSGTVKNRGSHGTGTVPTWIQKVRVVDRNKSANVYRCL